MNCKEFECWIARYLECDLPMDRLAAFYSHAVACVECREYLHSYRKVVILLKEERRIA